MKPPRHLATVLALATLGLATSANAAPPDDETELPPADETEAPPAADQAAPGDIVHSWALAPAGDEDGSTRPQFSYTASPGTVIEDALTVYNFGNEALPFRIYATDAFNNDNGDFTLLTGDDVPVDVGSWVDIELETLVVNPGRQVTIPFTITVPESAATGDHAGAVLASSPTTSRGEDDQGRVVVDRRTGSRLFVRVSGELRPELAIDGLTADVSQSANPFGASGTVTYRIENRGNVRLSGTVLTEMSGPFGLGGASTEPDAFDELLPGEGFDVTVELDGITPLGLIDTSVTVDDLTSGEGDELDPINRSNSQFAPPITLLLVLLVALFAVIAHRAIRRHRNPPVEVIAPGKGPEDRQLQGA